MDVTSSKSFLKFYIPVVAGEQIYYPSLSAIASQYQFYKFGTVGLSYTPVTGATTNGQLALAPVATYRDYEECTTWEQISGLPQSVTTNIWKEVSTEFWADSFNRQVVEGWRSIVPAGAIDYDDVTQTQGFIVCAVIGCDTTDLTKILGRLSVSYDATLFKPRINAVISDTVTFNGAPATLDDGDIEDGSERLCSVVASSATATEFREFGSALSLLL